MYGSRCRLAILAHRPDKTSAITLQHCGLRQHKGLTRADGQLNPHELPGQDVHGRIGELGPHLHRAQPRVDGGGSEVEAARTGIGLAIGQLEPNASGTARRLELLELGIRQGKAHPHRIGLGNAGDQSRLGIDRQQIAFGALHPTSDAGDRSHQRGIRKIEFRFAHPVLGRIQGRRRGLERGAGIVIFTLTDGLGSDQPLEPFGLAPRLLVTRTLLCQGCARLGQCQLERRRIDAHQNRTGTHRLAFGKQLFFQDAADPRPHLDFTRALGATD